MDERRSSPSVDRRRDAPSSALPFAEQREQVRRFLNELTESADSAEADISAAITKLLADVARMRPAETSKELAEREEAARDLSHRADSQLKSIVEERSRLEHEMEELARKQARLDDKLRRAEAREEELEAEGAKTKTQRRRIAAELRDEREAVGRDLRRLEAERAEMRAEAQRHDEDLQRRIADVERRAAETASVAASAGADVTLRKQAAEHERLLAERDAEIGSLAEQLDASRREIEKLEASQAKLQQRLDATSDAERLLTRAEAEADELRRALAEAETRLTEPGGSGNDSQELEALKRLYDEAQEDIRDLERRNAALERAKAASGPVGGDDQAMDWESQKRRLLAALEADLDPNDEQDKADKLTIEGTIQITDNMIQQRDHEIAELKQLLDEQSRNVGSVSVGAAAFAAVLDQDELICEHRIQTEEIKKQWEEKLRAAEVELSIERAKLARERTEMEEKRNDWEKERARIAEQGPTPAPGDKDSGKKGASGGRWLARLGLRDQEGG
jgi:hypothetical protein